MKRLLFLLIPIVLLAGLSVRAETWILVDFGASQPENAYGLPGWETAFTGPHTGYSSAGPGGTTMISGDSPLDDWQGVSGPAREFVRGERVTVHWYNASAEVLSFTPLVSFTDPDGPVDAPGEPQWYGMSSVEFLYPGETGSSEYRITDQATAPAQAPPSQGAHARVSVCVRLVNQGWLVCDRIELDDEVDITAPDRPAGLVATTVSASALRLDWIEPADDVGVSQYRVYRDGRFVRACPAPPYTDRCLTAGSAVAYRVAAEDAAGNLGEPSEEAVGHTAPFQGSPDRIDPAADLEYRGAFRLPELPDGDPQENWHYAGLGLAHRPGGDPDGPADGYPGSLFGVGHPWDCRVGEIDIPVPVISPARELAELNRATQLQPMTDVAAFDFQGQLPRVDLAHLPAQGSQETEKLYTLFGDAYEWGKIPSLGACETDLADPRPAGAWSLGSVAGDPPYLAYNQYLFALPEDWAGSQVGGRRLVAGQFREGGVSGLGPSLYAFAPWQDSDPLPGPDAALGFTCLLQYGPYAGPDVFERSVDMCRLTDRWAGADWLSDGDRSAVILTGTKGMGDDWYGFFDGTRYSDVWADVPATFSYAQQRDKGWFSDWTEPQILLYDPADLAAVAAGGLEPWEPQPYAVLPVEEELLFRTYELNEVWKFRAAACDPEGGHLYVLEALADGSNPLIHVWRLGESRQLAVDLVMPAEHYTPGTECWVEARIRNPGDEPDQGPLVVLLDLGLGDYWFWPSWVRYPPGVDYRMVNLPMGESRQTIVPSFLWPEGAGSWTGAAFHGAVLTPDLTSIRGRAGSVWFTFGR